MKLIIILAVMFIGIVSASFMGCIESRVRSSVNTHEFLFPLGNYRHQVKVIPVNSSGEAKVIEFSGAVQLSREWIKVVGLSPFGTTLMKIQEDRATGKVEFVSYLEAFKKFESKFQEYYATLKLVLAAPEMPTRKDGLEVTRKNDQGHPIEFTIVGQNPAAVVKILKYDEHQVPEEFTIVHPHYMLEIKVSGYEL